MFSSLIAKILGGTSLVLLLGLAFAVQRANHWHRAYDKLHGQAVDVLTALSQASGQKIPWEVAPGQIVALGETVRAQRLAIEATNLRIDQMAAEAVRLRAKADELRALAEKAEAQRRSALLRLGNMAETPGTRSDCMQLLKEANDALDLIREAS